jgi:hypothetical protein
MTDYLSFNVRNQTLFPLQIATPATAGSDWQQNPAPVSGTNIAPGKSAMLGVISEPWKLGTANYDWLYLNWLLFDPVTSSSTVTQLQTFGKASTDANPWHKGLSQWGQIGLYSQNSGKDNQMPCGGTPAAVVSAVQTTPAALEFYFSGAETAARQFGQSSAFAPAIGEYVGGGAHQLVIVGATPFASDQVPTLYWISCDLMQEPDLLTGGWDPRAWQKGTFSTPTPASSLSQCALAQHAGNLYTIWAQCDYNNEQVSWRLVSSEYAIGESQTAPSWGSMIQMRDPGGNPINSGGNVGAYSGSWLSPDIACTAFGENGLIVAAMLPKSTTGTHNSGQQQLALMMFDFRDIQQDTSQPGQPLVWNAKWIQQSPATFAWLGGDQPGRSVAVEWYATGLNLYLVLAINTVTPSYGVNLAIFSLASLSDGGTIPQAVDLTNPEVSLDQSASGPATLKRDFAGRVVMLYPTGSTGPTGGNAGICSRLTIPSTIEPHTFQLGVIPTEILPAPDPVCPALFSTLALGSKAQTTSTVGNAQYSATIYPIYELLAYGSPVAAVVRPVGWAETVTGLDLGPPSPKPQTKNTVVVSGIIDGPIPLPNENVSWETQTATNYSNPITTLSYGTTVSKTDEHQVSVSGSVGFKSTGEMTAGMGPAWDISLSAGVGRLAGGAFTAAMENAQAATSEFYITDQSTSASVVAPYGALFCSRVTATADRYRFLVPGTGGTPSVQPASDAGTVWLYRPSFSPSGVYTFVPYSVMPGNLFSYTSEAWTKRMTQLGVYTGQDYIADVIEKQAYMFADGSAEGSPKLTFSWSDGETSFPSSYTEISESFVESSWSIDSSVYMGFSGAAGANVFGVGAELQFSVMAGVSFSYEHQQTETTGTSWSIGLDTIGLLAQSVGDSQNHPDHPVSAFTFDLYFLPSSNTWAKELIEYVVNPDPNWHPSMDPTTIDPGSAPWRIVFVVTSITDASTPPDTADYSYPPMPQARLNELWPTSDAAAGNSGSAAGTTTR